MSDQPELTQPETEARQEELNAQELDNVVGGSGGGGGAGKPVAHGSDQNPNASFSWGMSTRGMQDIH